MLADLIPSIQEAANISVDKAQTKKFIEQAAELCLPGANVFILDKNENHLSCIIRAVIHSYRSTSDTAQKDTQLQFLP